MSLLASLARPARLFEPAQPVDAKAAEKRLLVVAIGLLAGYGACVLRLALVHGWVMDGNARPIPTDFLAIWSAGQLVLQGHALWAYDGLAQNAAETAAVGHAFTGYYGWPYPPSFLFAAAGLGLLPYAWAFAVLAGGSAVLHGVSVAVIARRVGAAVVALAAPWALACLMVGQNGFLTAGLLGFALLNLDRRPVLAGALFGLLTYKPQFGLLIPLALAAGGRWRAFAWAAVTTLLLCAVSWAAFGPGVFTAFLATLPRTGQTLISQGGVGWGKLQSVYGLLRWWLGATDAAAWTAQGLVSLASAAAVVALWRGPAAPPAKAAGLAAAAALATPYVFAYDLPILAVAAAFAYRQRRFDRLDYLALAVAGLSLAPFLLGTAAPTGLAAGLAIGAMAFRRASRPAVRLPAAA